MNYTVEIKEEKSTRTNETCEEGIVRNIKETLDIFNTLIKQAEKE